MEAFQNDFRCITMDQRNANNGESTGPVPVDNPWDAFADDQLGLMDHLGIRDFIGNCRTPMLVLPDDVSGHPLQTSIAMVSHSFIAYHDDSADESQPITFADDSWRDYIPIALPWTVCVRERLPAGSVAVLINRSHTFSDLICTVDSFEDRLLGAIDGNRTLGEILRLAFPEGDGERRALRFFERLWQYDQIVFDVSRAEPSLRDAVSSV
jgi:hypothetical protein